MTQQAERLPAVLVPRQSAQISPQHRAAAQFALPVQAGERLALEHVDAGLEEVLRHDKPLGYGQPRHLQHSWWTEIECDINRQNNIVQKKILV